MAERFDKEGPAGRWFSFEWAWRCTHDDSSWTGLKIDGVAILRSASSTEGAAP